MSEKNGVVAPSAGLFDNLLAAGDAETELASALIDHQLRLNAPGIKAALFLRAYGLGDVADEILRLRRYQSGDKGMIDALQSVSLKSFMRQLSINLGNK